MRQLGLNTSVFTDPGWWHWAATIPPLAAHLGGVRWAIEAVLVLCGLMATYYLLRVRDWRPLPAQVRLAYLGWISLGLLPWMGWMHAVALAGTIAVVVVGYCPLARMLGLLWYNRSELFTARLAWRQIVAAPSGGLIDLRGHGECRPLVCTLVNRPTLEQQTFAERTGRPGALR